MRLALDIIRYDLRVPFRISSGVLTHVEALSVTLRDGHLVGRGEAIGVPYLNESAISMRSTAESVRAQIENGIDPPTVQTLLGRCGARNALDAAVWDLEAKRAGRRVWELLGLSEPQQMLITTTLVLDSPERMALAARNAPSQGTLKLKLGDAPADLARVRAVREAVGNRLLVVDANGGWTFDELRELTPALASLGVAMIEQPLARGHDAALTDWSSDIPLCADESCLARDDLLSVAKRYAMINIKLDKTGGLTEALATANAARALGLPYMVGCMVESSLGLAPATLLAEGALWCDLDGPTFLAADREPRLTFTDGWLEPPPIEIWG